MSLTYTETTYHEPTHKTVELEIPDDWAMFTPAGNKRIKKLAEELYKKAEDPNLTTGQKVDALISFHRKWEALDKYKSYSEAGDTAVRECVGWFHDKVAEALGLDGNAIWEQGW